MHFEKYLLPPSSSLTISPKRTNSCTFWSNFPETLPWREAYVYTQSPLRKVKTEKSRGHVSRRSALKLDRSPVPINKTRGERGSRQSDGIKTQPGLIGWKTSPRLSCTTGRGVSHEAFESSNAPNRCGPPPSRPGSPILTSRIARRVFRPRRFAPRFGNKSPKLCSSSYGGGGFCRAGLYDAAPPLSRLYHAAKEEGWLGIPDSSHPPPPDHPPDETWIKSRDLSRQ